MQHLWLLYNGEVCLHHKNAPALLALTTLGDATQIEIILFVLHCQGK
jgi:hypothetical protein